MQVELSKAKNDLFEIWVDQRFIKTIPRKKGESFADYKVRAEKEFDDYIIELKNIKNGTQSSSKTVKITTI